MSFSVKIDFKDASRRIKFPGVNHLLNSLFNLTPKGFGLDTEDPIYSQEVSLIRRDLF